MQADLDRIEIAIAEVKAGDPSALHYLQARYAEVVRAYVASIVGDRTDAEDITQDVFQKLPRAIAGYEAGALPFEGWLLRQGRSSALDFLRKKSEMSPERTRGAPRIPRSRRRRALRPIRVTGLTKENDERAPAPPCRRRPDHPRRPARHRERRTHARGWAAVAPARARFATGITSPPMPDSEKPIAERRR